MDRTEKHEFVASLASVFAETSMVVVTQNKGLTVAEVSDLRRKMRAGGSTYKVAKNRLAVLALEGSSFDGIKPMLKGPTALAWSKDPVAVAKTAVDFAKTNEKLVIIGGALGTQTLDAAGVKVFGDAAPRLDNTLCFAAHGLAADLQVMALDIEGVMISAGAACSSGKVARSHVLEAMGLGTLAGEAIRVSLPWDVQEAAVDGFIAAYMRLAAGPASHPGTRAA